MPIVPRTPIVPNRYPVFYSTQKDCNSDEYDKFIKLYIRSSTPVKLALLDRITKHLENPVYEHLINTMNNDNVHHILGYLKTQNCGKLHSIIGILVKLYDNN